MTAVVTIQGLALEHLHRTLDKLRESLREPLENVEEEFVEYAGNVDEDDDTQELDTQSMTLDLPPARFTRRVSHSVAKDSKDSAKDADKHSYTYKLAKEESLGECMHAKPRSEDTWLGAEAKHVQEDKASGGRKHLQWKRDLHFELDETDEIQYEQQPYPISHRGSRNSETNSPSSKTSKLHISLSPGLGSSASFQFSPRDQFRQTQGGTVHVCDWVIDRNGIAQFGSKPQRIGKGRLTFADAFAIVGPLGRGATGLVFEAVHIPTLTLVAIKKVPVFNKDKRKAIPSELNVLCQQLQQISEENENRAAKSVDDELEKVAEIAVVSPRSTFHGSCRTMDSFRSSLAAHSLSSSGCESESKSSGLQKQAQFFSSSADDSPSSSTVVGTSVSTLTDGASSYEGRSETAPHLLNFYGAFVDKDAAYVNLVVEYMDGGSLQDKVDKGPCTDENVLADISSQILKGLCVLHNDRRIHRDIKPANILINSRGMVKIGDFGISKKIDESFTQTFVGTLVYMSPERVCGGLYDESSDIWSFGLTILQLALGDLPALLKVQDQHPDNPDSFWNIKGAICEDELPLPVAGFSEHFNDFICHCLTRDKDHRPSARDLLQHAFIAPLHCTETDSEPSSAKTARVGTTKSTPLSGSKMATIDENEGVGDEPDAAPRAAQEDSLRLEHLDRILEAIKRKLEQAEMHTQLRSTRHSTDGDQTCCSRYTKEQIFRLSRPPSSGADAYTLSVSGPESFAYTGGSTNDGDSMSPLATSRDSNKWTHLALQLGLKCSIVYDRAREELFAHRRGRLN